MGESVTEGSIVEWRVKPGAWIEAGATLVDVTTDKVDIEVPAPASGLVRAILAEEGATVAVGAPLVEIDTSAERPPEGATPATSPQASADGASRAAAGNGTPAANGAPPAATGRPGGPASHRAQRIAERENLDLSRIAGSGPGGLILRADVERVAATPEARAAATANGA